jgi:hypothetical protein
MRYRNSFVRLHRWALWVGIGIFIFSTGFGLGSSSAFAADDAELVMAVDISHWSGTITEGEVACWRDSGVRHVISGTQNPDITVQQLQTAVNGGLTVDAYVMLYWDYDIAGQVQDALATITGFPVGRLWLDAEQPSGGRSAAQLIQKIQQAVDACGSMSCGIYTRKAWWLDNLGDTTAFSQLPIWYAYYDHNSDFDDWYDPVYWYEGPFGGWIDPTGKQYDSDWTAPDLCGVNVDYNIMVVSDVPDSGTGTGEVGFVTINQPNASVWHTVNLINPYTDPVVIMQPASFNGGHPTTIRIRNITENAFEFQMDEWDYLDGAHTTETIGYLVMEAGAYELPDGGRVEAGTIDVDHNFTEVAFNQTFAAAPMVLTQAQTFFGSAAVVTRQRDTHVGGFQVKVQEEEGNDGSHDLETVGYIAIAPGAGTIGDMAYEVQLTPDAVTHDWYTIDFKQSYSEPIFLAGMQSYDGGNTAAVRYKALGADQSQVFVEEEQSADSEIWHTTETIGYAVFDHAGSLTMVGPPPAPTDLNPPDGETITTSAVTLSCAAIADAFQYEFEIGYDDEGTWQYYYTYRTVAAAQTFWPVYDDTIYRWRVRAENIHGLGAWSDWASFNFGDVGNAVPPAPSGLTPPDGQTITTASVTLSCDAIADVFQYEFEIWYHDGSTWKYYYTYSPATSSQTFWPAVDDTSYRWRVRAENDIGVGEWSVWSTFNFI